MSQEDIFGFQIAVNDFVVVKEDETVQELLGKSSDQFQGEASEIMSFDEFVKIHSQEVGRNAKMPAEVEALVEIDDAMLFVWVLHVLAVFIFCSVRLTHSLSFCRMLTSTRAC